MIAQLQLAVLYLAPAALLLLLLWAGRYPGERLVTRLAVRRRSPRRRAPRSLLVPWTPSAPRVGGGRLLARRLAGRGPPVVAVVR